MIVSYFIFSLPYLYLIYHWEGLVPIATQEINVKTITSIEDLNNIYQIHFGYCATLIAFYLLPIIFFTHKDLLNKIMEMFKIKFTYTYLYTTLCSGSESSFKTLKNRFKKYTVESL